ncbi:MAG: HlyD family efflux transporter periplasmic adaptor subunit [Sphingomonadales bacterium]|nr:MAG: HlyD family efflux transporter periplasmic adaptor subunit [Sphingomonadales bacterium]TNF04920.1 MAG: HlyD family efflux transporter periplasmic adaptor subunit [Sphingomonadales bacterium]
MAEQILPPSVNEQEAPTDKIALRKRLFLIFGLILAVLLLLLLIWQYFFAWRSVSTDNAYVGADVAQITPLVAGPVAAVLVQDTTQVKAGDILVKLDDADARIALQRAEAALARAERGFRETTATGQSLLARADARTSDIEAARAQVTVAQANFDRAKIDYDRRRKLAETGAVSGDELTAATNAFRNAQASLTLSRAQLTQAEANRNSATREADANLALTKGTTESTSPDVLAARAARDQARIDLERTIIRAPFDGIVAQRRVQIGQRVAAGAQLMTIVPLNALYVDANLKEGQLKRVRAGQPAELTSDLYGSDVTFHGRVVGLAGGTGSAFALIPAQNATGNWIKVVQRLPVRIALDPRELAEHPLRVGLSMEATVNVDGR